MNYVEKHNSQDDYYSIELAAISQGENKCTSGGNFRHLFFFPPHPGKHYGHVDAGIMTAVAGEKHLRDEG